MNIGNLQIESNNIVVSSNRPVDAVSEAGTAQTPSTVLSDLSVGDTISGKMIAREGNVVSLLLSDDTVIQAKLEKELQMQPGQMITFTVKSNGQKGMSLMPLFTNTSDMNTAAKALMNAGLPVNDKSMKMVSSMMEEGMPIGRDSLLFMKGQMNSHPTADVTNLVQMQRMGISITEENIEQFSNYKNYEHQINHATDYIAGLVSDTIGDMLSSGNVKEAIAFYKDIAGMIVDSDSAIPVGTEKTVLAFDQLSNAEIASLAKAVVKGEFSETELATLKEDLNAYEQKEGTMSPELTLLKHAAEGTMNQNDLVRLNHMFSANAKEVESIDAKQLLAKLVDETGAGERFDETSKTAQLDDTQKASVAEKIEENQADTNLPLKDETSMIAKLEQLMKGVTVAEDNKVEDKTNIVSETGSVTDESQVEEGNSKGQLTNTEKNQLSVDLQKLGLPEHITKAYSKGEISEKELLSYIHKNINSDDKMQELLGTKTFRKLLSNELSNAWKITPEQTSSKTEVKDLYKRIDEQTRQIMDALQATTKADSPLASAVTRLQNNLDFMNQINQMFPYIQLPLSMSGSDAHGELFVYTNKKNLAKQDGSVSALLHLDMAHLGTLDVMVKMNSEQYVNTNFCVADESVLDLIEAHIDELTSRLNKRGYKMDTSYSLQEKASNVMEEMIKQDRSVSMISTTAFDARA